MVIDEAAVNNWNMMVVYTRSLSSEKAVRVVEVLQTVLAERRRRVCTGNAVLARLGVVVESIYRERAIDEGYNTFLFA